MSGWSTSRYKISMHRHAVRPSILWGNPVMFFWLTQKVTAQEICTLRKVVPVLLLVLVSPKVRRWVWTHFWCRMLAREEKNNSSRPGMCHRKSAASRCLMCWRFHWTCHSLDFTSTASGFPVSCVQRGALHHTINKVGGEWCSILLKPKEGFHHRIALEISRHLVLFAFVWIVK